MRTNVINRVVSDGQEVAISFGFLKDSKSLIPTFFTDIDKRVYSRYLGNSIPGLEYHYRVQSWVLEDRLERFYHAFVARANELGVQVSQSLEDCQNLVKNAELDQSLFIKNQSIDIFFLGAQGCLIKPPFAKHLNLFLRDSGFNWNQKVSSWTNTGILPYEAKERISKCPGVDSEQISLYPVVYEFVGGEIIKPKETKRDIGPLKKVVRVVESENEEEEERKGPVLVVAREMERFPLHHGHFDRIVQKYSLAPHQIEGFRRAATMSSYLNADDMGLGKTRCSVASADYLCTNSDRRVLVVAEKVTLLQWKRTILDFNPDDKVAVAEFNPKAKWTIVTYQGLDTVLDQGVTYDILIADEAHNFKNTEAAITDKLFLKLSGTKRKILLTGTPILNRMAEFYSLLRFSGHPAADSTLPQFLELYDNESGRQRIKHAVGDWIGRHLKKEVLGDLIKSKTHKRKLFDLDPKEEKQYLKILAEEEDFFSKVSKLRLFLEKARIKRLPEYIQAKDSPRSKFIIFTAFLDTIPATQRMLKKIGIESVTIEGKHSLKKRDASQQSFQEDKNIRAVVVSMECGGSGLDLQKANNVIFLSSPWNNGIKSQCEDRAYRLGNKQNVNVHDLLFRGTFDLDIEEIVNEKIEVVRSALDGVTSSSDRSVMKELRGRMDQRVEKAKKQLAKASK